MFSTSTSTSIHDTQIKAWTTAWHHSSPLIAYSFLDCLLMEDVYVCQHESYSFHQLMPYQESQASTSPCTCRKTLPWDPNQWVCQWFRTSRIWNHSWLAPKRPNQWISLPKKVQKGRIIWRMSDTYPVLQNPTSTFTTEFSMQQTSRSIVRLVDFRLSFSDLKRWRWDLGG